MKKTFQKEMRSSAERTTASAAPPNGHTSPIPPLAAAMASSSKDRGTSSPPKSTRSSFSYDPNAVEDMVPMTDVNLRYLKHVIFKFFTSREYEVREHGIFAFENVHFLTFSCSAFFRRKI